MNEKLRVLKIGGSVFHDQFALPTIAHAIADELRADGGGNKVIVVVSAMRHATDELLQLLTTERADMKMRDMLLSTGENVATALVANYLAMALGLRARGFTGGQAGIMTDENFGDANITNVDTAAINEFLKEGDVAVVAGFQGVTKSGDITTLGRNGSDTTAFYLAHYFDAGTLTLYKDTNGIYDGNPKVRSDARLYKTLNYKEVLSGETAGIIHDKALGLCAEMFRNKNPRIIVRNIFSSQNQFTTISKSPTEFY